MTILYEIMKMGLMCLPNEMVYRFDFSMAIVPQHLAPTIGLHAALLTVVFVSMLQWMTLSSFITIVTIFLFFTPSFYHPSTGSRLLFWLYPYSVFLYTLLPFYLICLEARSLHCCFYPNSSLILLVVLIRFTGSWFTSLFGCRFRLSL